MLINTKDKNSQFQQNYIFSNGDLDNLYNLSDSEIQENAKKWAEVFAKQIDPIEHSEIGGKPIRPISEISTEEWMNLQNIIENVDFIEKSFFQILITMTGKGLTVKDCEDLEWRQALEYISFFFENLQEYILYIKTSSHLKEKGVEKTPAQIKKFVEMITIK